MIFVIVMQYLVIMHLLVDHLEYHVQYAVLQSMKYLLVYLVVIVNVVVVRFVLVICIKPLHVDLILILYVKLVQHVLMVNIDHQVALGRQILFALFVPLAHIRGTLVDLDFRHHAQIVLQTKALKEI